MDCDCDVIVLDFDGVLVEPVDVYEWAPEHVRARNLGLLLLQNIPHHMKIYIVSGRSAKWLYFIKDTLKSMGVSLSRMEFCLNRERSEIDHKLYCAERILEKEGCIYEWHDDNPYVLESLKRYVCGALVIHRGEGCWVIKGSSRLGQLCNER
ncbi:MAG: hypothetical protein GSR72_04865 [Desulfurococcales archaeon]|nr:hypothetical protein [Desulfurococcales archaeon]MEB3789203.1 hypothetical protein [Desulfurococcales archaeon]